MQQPCTSLHPAAVALFLCTKLHNALDCLGLKFAIHLHPSLSLLHLTLHYTGLTEVTVQAMNCIATLHLTSLKLQSTASCSEFDILTALNYVQCSLHYIVLHCTKHRTMHRTALLAAVNLISEHFPVMVTFQLSPTPAAGANLTFLEHLYEIEIYFKISLPPIYFCYPQLARCNSGGH